MARLILYQFEECPFCAKVRAKLEEKRLSYGKVDVAHERSDPLRQELLQKSGVATVPVLKVNEGDGERYIGGSDKIIEYLEKSFR